MNEKEQSFDEWWDGDWAPEDNPQYTMSRKDAAKLAWEARGEIARQREAELIAARGGLTVAVESTFVKESIARRERIAEMAKREADLLRYVRHEDDCWAGASALMNCTCGLALLLPNQEGS